MEGLGLMGGGGVRNWEDEGGREGNHRSVAWSYIYHHTKFNENIKKSCYPHMRALFKELGLQRKQRKPKIIQALEIGTKFAS